jgi:hypothetical protein
LARAAGDTRRLQVAAATADALAALESDVLTAPVTPELDVRTFVERTRSRDALSRAVRRAEQIGGTRWLDDQTCQVRMELPGAVVADTLVGIAETYPREAGLPAEVLRRRVDGLRELTFAATGMSTGAVDRLRPDPDQPAWRGVPDGAVQAAVADARRHAAAQVLEGVESIEVPGSTDKVRLGQVIADRKVRDALEGWLMTQPVTSVVFQPDLEVRVSVAMDGESFWDQLAAVAGDRKDLAFPPPGDARDALRLTVVREVRPTIGRARVRGDGGATTIPAAVQQVVDPVDIPADPPRWIVEQVDARGASRAVDGRLKTARAAENVARDRLREQVEGLPLSRKLTLGDAAQRDPRVRTAIDRAVGRARPRKVNYLSDGGAEVTFTLELREVWYQLEDR